MPQGRGTPKRSKKNGTSRRKPAHMRLTPKWVGAEDRGGGGKGDTGLHTNPPAGR